MSSKSKGQKGAFGGLKGKRRKAQIRYLATRQNASTNNKQKES